MGRSLQRFGWVPLVAAAALLFFAARDLPTMGDPSSPAAEHVSPRYIEKAQEEAGAPNMVTAVLADYRGYDTLGEVVVILTAGLACLLVLVFFGTGLVSLFFGKNFLDYSALPLPYAGAHLREVGSLTIEFGVFIAVTAVLVLIFHVLSSGAED